MKIYFAGSIRGGRDDQELYLSIINEVGKYGSVLTEHIGDKSLSNLGEQSVTNSFIFERDMQWVRESDVIVAEVSTPSLGVGYELGKAEAMGKRILCIYREIEGKRLSAMVAGNSYPTIRIYRDLNDVQSILKDFFTK
jgi:nucleoside 2-deoxyribosyltransferase